MPGMDGIECLARIRDQQGGLNRNTPVIVLTANAGSENRELYNNAGFDGYLVKPVSGGAMEEILIKFISPDKIVLRNVIKGNDEEIHTTDKYADKVPIIITSTSMCDLPESVVRKLHIPIIPFIIKTEDGEFKDGVHIDANELIRHISLGKEALSFPPGESDYTEFFADVLKRAHHVIHISLTTGMSKDYQRALEAAKSFDNVTVINSQCLSSASGILVLIGYKLIQQGMRAEEIVKELESVKHRLKCSFIMNTTEYMVKSGYIKKRFHKLAEALNIRPALGIKNDKPVIDGMWAGSTRRAYRKYISHALPPDIIPDPEVLFVTYVDIPEETLAWIEEEIRKIAYFERIVFKQASAAISSNCGPGTFGILYFLKSNKSYNIASYIDDVSRADDAYYTGDVTGSGEDDFADGLYDLTETYENSSEPEHDKWYENLEGIDFEEAVKNSGSEESFKAVLKIFHASVDDKYEELEKYYSLGDWENYTVKIHALKSSARLVGAMKLGEQARLLETAGKEKNIDYIKINHESVMKEFLKFKELLSPVFGTDDSTGMKDKPVADDFLIKSVYDGLKEAAEKMDCDMIEDIFKEINEYEIPEPEKEKFKSLREKADALDYDGIVKVLKEQ